MFKTLLNIFRVPELRNKVLFTLMMLAIFRIGHAVPLPGIDQAKLAEQVTKQSSGDTAGAKLAAYVSLFSGGSLSHGTIFGLGVMPYISASIIFQLLATVLPSLEKLQKEGETGRRKIQEWTRYASVPVAALQAYWWLQQLVNQDTLLSTWKTSSAMLFLLPGVIALTAGCIFLMWIGEQIDEYGLGQGVSMIIMAGILCRMPHALQMMYSQMDFGGKGGDAAHHMTSGKVIVLLLGFVFVIATAILITQAQRRITIIQAKHVRGRRVMGGSQQYLPLKVNIGGVMPVIFAQSLMMFPTLLFSWIATATNVGTDAWSTRHGSIYSVIAQAFAWLDQQYKSGEFLYFITEVAMIYFFAFFWTTVQFKPKEIANNLRDYGSFVKGLRPGKRTAEYLEKIMMRMTYVGAAFLCMIAVVPTLVNKQFGIDYEISQFLGGTGLLIVVSVVLDMVQRLEANLLTRNYEGFLGEQGGGRIKGRQY